MNKTTRQTVGATLALAVMLMVGNAAVAENPQVHNVAELVAALAACDGSTETTIEMATGDYQLTSAQQTTSSSWGVSHLTIPNKVTLKGTGTKPEDVRLIGDGVTGRIMWLPASSTVENLTLTNGVTVDVTGTYAKRGAAVGGNGVLTNCLIIGNNALGIGGAASTGTLATGMRMYKCRVLNNTGSSGGGVHNIRCWDCLIAGNVATTGEGGGGYTVMVTDCIVSNNSTLASKNGGGLYGSSGTGTKFLYNTAGQKGGGASSASGTSGVYSGIYSNCVFFGNSSKGGAAYRHVLVDCKVSCNMSSANGGGGTFECSNVNCQVWNNFATTYGGGVYSGISHGTVISNNFAKGTGPNTYAADLFDCKIFGMAAANGSATRCVFTGIGDTQSLTENPYWTTNQYSVYAYYDYPNATNCLFIGNRLTTSSSSLFCGVQSAKKSSSIVNCTIISNAYNFFARYFRLSDYPLTIQNTVQYGNMIYGTTTLRDINIATTGDNRCDVGALTFDHCAYGVKTSSLDLSDYVVGNSLYCFGVDGFGADPKFRLGKDPAHPYSLRLSSPLVGRGAVADWMTDAYDLRGTADDGKYLRLRDGAVDIGCYQCWLDPVGMTFTIR